MQQAMEGPRAGHGTDTWRPLYYFSLYRCALAVLLLLLVLWGVMPRDEVNVYPKLFRWMVAGYVVYSVLAVLAVRRQWVRLERQVVVQIVVDIVTMQTSIPGVFACGDCRANRLKQVAVAVGEGALAAVEADKYIEEL